MLRTLIELKVNGHSDRDIAEAFEVPYRAVTSKIRALRKEGKLQDIAKPEENIEEVQRQRDFWKKHAQSVSRELRKAQLDNTAVEILVEQIKDVAPIGYVPPKPLQRKPSKKAGSPQSAVLLFSDTHVGKVVTPEQTNDFGTYNFDVFRRMMKRLEDSIFSILADHTTTEVPEIVVAMLGDMLDGALQHSAEIGQVNTVFDQFYSAGHVIAQFFNNISQIAPLRIHTAVGNHTRWQNQRKFPTDNRFSNFDQVLYAYVQALLKGNDRVTIHLDKQMNALFEVQGYQFFANHGAGLRGGDKILGIPNHAMGRCVSNTAQRFLKAKRQAPHYYLFGHLHKGIELPHGLGKIIINGGFPGDDGFGLSESFTPAPPTQKFFLVHPKYAMTANYELQIGTYDPAGPLPYDVPEQFLCQ